MSRAYCSAHMMSVLRLLQLIIALHDLVSLNCSGDVPTNDVCDSPADLKICRLLGKRLPGNAIVSQLRVMRYILCKRAP